MFVNLSTIWDIVAISVSAQKDPEAEGKSKQRIFIQWTNSGSLCSPARKGIHRTGKNRKKQNWNSVADLTWARGCAVPVGVASSNFHRRQYSPEGCARGQMDHRQPTTERLCRGRAGHSTGLVRTWQDSTLTRQNTVLDKSTEIWQNGCKA